MTRSCYLCGMTISKTKRISLHHFPKDPVVCQKWLEACNLNNNDNVAGIFICSSHFPDEDVFKDNPLWNPRLKRGAIPSINIPNPLAVKRHKLSESILLGVNNDHTYLNNCLIQNELTHSMSKLNSFCLQDNINLHKSDTSKIKGNFINQEIIQNQIEPTSSTSNANPFCFVVKKNLESSQSEFNVTAHFSDNEQISHCLPSCEKENTIYLVDTSPNNKLQCEATKCQHLSPIRSNSPSNISDEEITVTPEKKRRYYDPRYISEISSPDFATPSRIRRNIKLIKELDLKKNKKIRSLQNKNRNLLNRIKTLKEKIKYLNETKMKSSQA